ncbi:MAG: glycoside hydrolase [Acidobacteriota bacterium]|nr:glycoside hydrolase [Acidobacteriota bacterium]
MKTIYFKKALRLLNKRRYALLTAFFTIALGISGFILEKSAKASDPPIGSIGVGGATVTWVGTATGPAGGLPQNEAATCQEGVNCDIFTLNVTGTQADWKNSGGRINVLFTWATPAIDYDMIVRKEDNGIPGYQAAATGNTPADSIINSSGGSTTIEQVIISPGDSGIGTYYVRAYYFAGGGPHEQYNGSAAYITVPVGLPQSQCTAPEYDNYQPPAGMPNRNNAGEPSVGANWNTGNILTQARLYSYRASFNDSTSPADPTTGVSWLAKRTPLTVTGLDPILFTDSVTGRTFGGELNGAGHQVGGISDDDLANFTQGVFGGNATQGVDHQTIGGGPPRPGVVGRQPAGGYPHLVYYASQQIGYASISTSFDGGVTWTQDVPMWSLLQCSGLHGHIKVAPDGTVYVPNRNCSGKVAVAVSENNGLSWSIRVIPTSSSESDDPSIGIGAGGRLYVAYTAADKRPHVAVSDDKGLTWRDDYDLSNGIPGGVIASVFPSAVAGDNNRAAVFFLATSSPNENNADPTGTDGAPTTGADPSLADNFKGTWYPYIATTCDGGKSWSVVKADHDPLRPGMKNPVQQGVVCKNGTTCPEGPPDTRNLLDFNDITVDSRGRIVAAYADGCITNACINLPDHSAAKENNDGSATLTLIRQRSGMRLFGAFDPAGPTAPPVSPPAWAEASPRGNELKWATPNNGGSPLTAYRIYRGVGGQPGETLIAEVGPNVNYFRDRKVKVRLTNVFYHVTAVNALGESPQAAKVFARLKGE